MQSLHSDLIICATNVELVAALFLQATLAWSPVKRRNVEILLGPREQFHARRIGISILQLTPSDVNIRSTLPPSSWGMRLRIRSVP